MAKRKSRSKHRRRVGAASLNAKNPLVMLGSVAIGYLAADTINTPLDKALAKAFPPAGATATAPATAPSDTGNYVGMAAEVGIGALLLKSRGSSMVKTVAGGVLVGAGLKRALKKFGVIKGYQSIPAVGRAKMDSYQRIPAIGGYNVNGYKAGREQVLNNVQAAHVLGAL